MREDDEEDKRTYKVVVNHEEQYSIWFADREPPAGWREVGKSGLKAECLGYVKEVWTDMRPLSLRKAMEEAAKNPPPAEPLPPPRPRHPLGKDDLVERLEQPQPVEAGLRPERTLQALRDQVERGYVFMKFVNTGTELGIRIDKTACDLGALDSGKGSIKLTGGLTLNYNKVRYHGDLDLEALRGTGRLEFLAEVKPGETS